MNLIIIMMCLTCLTAIPGIYRILFGPSVTDRIIGLDLLFAVAIILSLLTAWESGRTVYLDIAIGLSISGFISTLAWSRLVMLQKNNSRSS